MKGAHISKFRTRAKLAMRILGNDERMLNFALAIIDVAFVATKSEGLTYTITFDDEVREIQITKKTYKKEDYENDRTN